MKSCESEKPSIHVEHYVEFLSVILSDIEAITGLDLRLDAREIEHRVAHEGLTFVTRILPAFYKAVLAGIEVGKLSPIVGFKKARSGPLPLFLSGLVRLLFSEDGTLRIDRDPYALGYIGTLCLMIYKVEFPYTEAQQAERLRKFCAVEQSLPTHIGRSTIDDELATYHAIHLLQALFKGFELGGARPKHGPGAVAGHEKGYAKYYFNYSDRIDEVFNYDEYFGLHKVFQLGGGIHHYPPAWPAQAVLDLSSQMEDQLPPSRGLFVNKNADGPRYISAEAKEAMWLQQLIGSALVRWVQAHPLTKLHVNFTDQKRNGRLALTSSRSGRRATLDMSDASDRVADCAVRLLFPAKIYRLLNAVRSEKARLPDGSIVTLRKHAPMGSACCFPVESIFFWALAVGSIQQQTGWSQWRARKHVYVYGDDIIVTKRFAEPLMRYMESFGLVFNRAKCFVKGPFRESCGVDAIDGVVVTSVKLRRALDFGKSDSSTIISLVDSSNQLFYAGYWRAATWLKAHVENLGNLRLPYVPKLSGCLGVTGYHNGYADVRFGWSSRYQSVSVKVRRIVPKDKAKTYAQVSKIPVATLSHGIQEMSFTDEVILSSINRAEAELEVFSPYKRSSTLIAIPAKDVSLRWKKVIYS